MGSVVSHLTFFYLGLYSYLSRLVNEGRFAIVTIRGAGCGGAAASGRSEGRRAQARIACTHPQGRAQHPGARERRARRLTNHAVRGIAEWKHTA